MSRKSRKQKRIDLIAARREQRAAKRSSYAAKKFEQERGPKPDPRAVSKIKEDKLT